MSCHDSVNPLPEKGQIVNVLGVKDLKSVLLPCTVIRRDEMLLTLRAMNMETLASGSLEENGRVRVVYTESGLVCHTAGTLEESIVDEGLLQVELDDAPVRMERREFVRAELVVDLYARPSDVAGATVAPDNDDPNWRHAVPVNLSGSGVRFPMEQPCDPDDSVFVALRLPSALSAIIAAQGKVIRLVETQSGVPEVAVQFDGLTREQEDELINLALRVRFEQLG